MPSLTRLTPARWASRVTVRLMASVALCSPLYSPLQASAQTGLAQLRAGNLPITVVYPTTVPNRPVAMGPFTLNVAMEAAPQRGNGRLIVLSHGTRGSALTEHDLARTLAQAGFVVAQPEHEGDNWRDPSQAGPESWKRRPLEASRAIDAVMQDPRFAPLLDTRRVGVHGMSAGGVTALSLAGAEWSVANLVQHCKAHMQQDADFCFNGLRSPAERAQRAASYEQAPLDRVDATPWGGAKVHDPRIAAVALSVPVAAPFSDASLAALRMPVAVIQAPRDTVLAPAWHSGRVLQLCSTCQLLGTLDGGHFDVLSPWPDAMAQQVLAVYGPQPSGFDRSRLPAQYQRLAAFFQHHLGNAP